VLYSRILVLFSEYKGLVPSSPCDVMWCIGCTKNITSCRTLATASLGCRSSNIKIDISSSSSSQAIVELAVNDTAPVGRICDVGSDRRLLLFEQSWSNWTCLTIFLMNLTTLIINQYMVENIIYHTQNFYSACMHPLPQKVSGHVIVQIFMGARRTFFQGWTTNS